MKKMVTRKLFCVVIGFLLVSFNSKADDLTSLIVNPSFELESEGTNLPVAATTVRFLPYGWSHKVTYNGNEIPWNVNENNAAGSETLGGISLGQSYGVNQSVQKAKDGLYSCFMAAAPSPAPVAATSFELYQEIPGLAPGKYLVKCKLVAFHNGTTPKLTTQRFFATTASANIVQYFGKEADYHVDALTSGETNTFAGWDLPTADGDADGVLKPMSIVIEVKAGETLRFGIKTNNTLANTGAVATDAANNTGWFKVDDFHLNTYSETPAPNDYTYKITNPSFELLSEGVKNTTHNNSNAHRSATTGDASDNWAPYGWSASFTGFKGNSYGVNPDGNDIDGGFCMWVQSNPFPTYELYQDITGLPAGDYKLTCRMWVQDAGAGKTRVTTQRLFANKNVQYFSSETDQDETTLTSGESNTFAGYVGTTNNSTTGRILLPLSVDVTIGASETLRIGVKSGNLVAAGKTADTNAGLMKLDDFRLTFLESSTALNNAKTMKATFSVVNGKLTVEGADAYQVYSINGVKVADAKSSESVNLATGIYVVKTTNGEVFKVIVK